MREYILGEMKPAERYQLLTRVVAPRPIAFVSTLSLQGHGNLAPFSYFTVGGSNPASCAICPVNKRDGSIKDSLRNLRDRGEYVIAVVTEAMASKVSQASYEYPPEVDEFDAVGLTRRVSEEVAPPCVAESPVNLECRVHQIVEHGEGPLASHWIIGEILRAHVDDSVISGEWPDNRKLMQIGRCGEVLYARAHGAALFEVPRPTGP